MKQKSSSGVRRVRMAASHKKHHLKAPKMLIEARRERKRSQGRYPILELDVDEDDLPMWQRVLYVLATLGCVILACIGAIFPVIPAIPFWILAIVCLSHAFPPFGRFVRNLRFYRWMLEKLNEPPKKKEPRYLTHAQKNRIMVLVSIVLAVVLCVAKLSPLPKLFKIPLYALPSIAWVVAFVYVYFRIREPEARIHPKAAKRPTEG